MPRQRTNIKKKLIGPSLEEIMMKLIEETVCVCALIAVPHVHCPFCVYSPPFDVPMFGKHLQEEHTPKVNENEGLTYLMCKRQCHGGTTSGHYHCRQCPKVFNGKLDLKHIEHHRKDDLSQNRPTKVFHTLTSVISPDLMDYIPADNQAICDTLQHKFNVKCSLVSDKLCVVKTTLEKMSKLYNFLSPLASEKSKDIDVQKVESIFQGFSSANMSAGQTNTELEQGNNSRDVHENGTQVVHSTNTQVLQSTNTQIVQDDNTQIVQNDNTQIVQKNNTQIVKGSNETLNITSPFVHEQHSTESDGPVKSTEIEKTNLSKSNDVENIGISDSSLKRLSSSLKEAHKLIRVRIRLKDCMKSKSPGESIQPKKLKLSRTLTKSSRITRPNMRYSKHVKISEKVGGRAIQDQPREENSTVGLKNDSQNIQTKDEVNTDDCDMDDNDYAMDDIDDNVNNGDEDVNEVDKEPEINGDRNTDVGDSTNIDKEEKSCAVDENVDEGVNNDRLDTQMNENDDADGMISDDEILTFEEENGNMKMVFQIDKLKQAEGIENKIKKEKLDAKKRWPCDLCGIRFTRKEQVKIHKRRQVCTRPPKPKSVRKRPPPEKRTCPICCKEVFYLDLHLKRKTCQKKTPEDYKCICTACGKGFINENLLSQHYRYTHGPNNKSLCPECGKKVWTKNLAAHLRERHHKGSKEMHMCQVCGTFYTRKSSLNSHILKEHTEGYDRYIHKCKECGKGFQNAYYLKGHVLTNHSDSEPTFQCHKCGKKFFQRHNLSNHFKQKHSASYLKCRLCHSGFNNKALLHNHFSKKHNVQFSWSEFIQGYHSCNQCGKLCTTEDQLKKHLKKCQEVHKTGSDEGATVQHHGNVVETQLEYEEQSEKYICAICHAMFDTKEEVDLHLVTHNY